MIHVIMKQTKSGVTLRTEKTSHSPCGMVMVNMCFFIDRSVADGAQATLFLKEYLELFPCHPVEGLPARG